MTSLTNNIFPSLLLTSPVTEKEVAETLNSNKHPFKSVIEYHGFIKPYNREKIRDTIGNITSNIYLNVDIMSKMDINDLGKLDYEIEKERMRLFNLTEQQLLALYNVFLINRYRDFEIGCKEQSIFIENGFSTTIIKHTIEFVIEKYNNVEQMCRNFLSK